MFSSGSAIMDVATGVVFVFLLVSLICSQVSDRISQWLRWRAKDLEAGFRDYIAGGKHDELVKKIYENPFVKSLVPEDMWVTKGLLKIPLLDKLVYTSELPLQVNIPGKTFALAILDTLIPNQQGQTNLDKLIASVTTLPTDSPVRAPLLSIISRAEGSMESVRKNIEDWYDNTMYKTTLIYQRHLWGFSFLLALVIAIGFNVDTISIGTLLWNDASVRAALVAEAGAFVDKTQQPSPQTPGTQPSPLDTLNTLNLPIGWTAQIRPTLCVYPTDWFPRLNPETQKVVAANNPCAPPPAPLRAYPYKIVGWLITALAGAQGAPFWFDLLRKLTRKG